ncbi:MAG: histidinol-phosphatase HisJ family protein [Bacteroidota bacterium]|nr:histidinol-phosphatase HisJ family protein [Bacteroidota bacterium]
MIDLHMHTILSDGKSEHEDHIKEAFLKGLTTIGFTDHICLKPVSWAIREEDIPVMVHRMQELISQNTVPLDILFGAELDYFPEKETELAKIIASLPLDYVIGSVHFIDDWNFDTDKSLYGKWSNDELYYRYFELVIQAAKSGLFDIIGHADLIKKFRIWPESDMDSLYEKVVKVLAENHVVVELNTSGYDRPCGEFFPNARFLEYCFHYGVNLTMGSDAHQSSQVGRYFDQAKDLLRQIGFRHLVTFKQRRQSIISL